LSRPFLEGEHPIAFAHRGGAKLWPENTLTAFRGALELGIRYIETDVHRTRDGQLVCFHDRALERTTDGHGPVALHTLAELRRLDAGGRFTRDGRTFPHRGAGVGIPTLEEALALDPGLRFNVEIKPEGPEVVELLWAFVERHRLQDRVLVGAAKDRQGLAFRRLARGAVPTSPGARGILRFWLGARTGLHRLLRFDVDALQVPTKHHGLTVVDAAFVRAAHKHGLHVHVWTVDDPGEMRRLLQLGVDGLMSDRPDLLLDVLGR